MGFGIDTALRQRDLEVIRAFCLTRRTTSIASAPISFFPWFIWEDYQAVIPVSDEISERVSARRIAKSAIRCAFCWRTCTIDPAQHAVPMASWRRSIAGCSSSASAGRGVDRCLRELRVPSCVSSGERILCLELSFFYVDVMKDPLYTLSPNSSDRRSAQTAIHQTVATLARLIAPVLPFTAEEVWSFLPAREAQSVHLATFPVADEKQRDKQLEARLEKLLEVRRVASLELEKGATKQGDLANCWRRRWKSQPQHGGDAPVAAGFRAASGNDIDRVAGACREIDGRPIAGAKSHPGPGKKCVRCWRWSEDVGADQKHPELCGRCVEVIQQVMEATP